MNVSPIRFRPFGCRRAASGLCSLLLAACCVLPSIGSAAFGEGSGPAANPEPADPAVYGIELSADDLSHWAFRPIVRPATPVPARDPNWVRNPIDAFILKKLEEKGLEPSPAADDRTWLRRVSYGLVGLPPAPEEVDAFLADRSENRFERAVDRLLDDPGYGIRWGRRWLDVVRYADTNGYERDGDKPSAWRYRDYVIDSLNADKPFQRFLTEQLAGDEFDATSAETMTATTFLRLGTWDDEPADPVVDRYDQLDDVVGTVSATFLGLTLRCARCHNHKFEPLSQIDYARMLAIFEPLERPQKGRTEFDVAVGTRGELADDAAAVVRHDAALAAVQAQVKALDDAVRERYFRLDQTKLPHEAYEAHKLPEGKRTSAQNQLVRETQKEFDAEVALVRTADEVKQREGFAAAIKALEAAVPSALPRAYIWREQTDGSVATQVLRRGNPTTPAGIVEPGFPAVLAGCDIPMEKAPLESRTTRRRLSLARWMTGAKNPLVARVIVNRLWQGHFGEGLVASENDFGVMGASPSNPELLDWLASELREPAAWDVGWVERSEAHRTQPGGPNSVRPTLQAAGEGAETAPQATPPGPPLLSGGENGAWRLKRMHKLIVLSSTYRQASDVRKIAAKADVENSLLWRYPYRRLEAEVLRDSVLFVNGRLNAKMGGPGVYPKIAREVLEGQSRPGLGWGAFDEREAARRSIYVFVKRSLLVPEMELLDFADTNTSCEQRPVSTIPTQALTLLNGEFFNQEAAHFAARLVRESGDDRGAQVDRAYRLALCRAPTADERTAALAFLDRQSQRVAAEDRTRADQPPRDAARTALEALCLVVYNLNEFAYVD